MLPLAFATVLVVLLVLFLKLKLLQVVHLCRLLIRILLLLRLMNHSITRRSRSELLLLLLVLVLLLKLFLVLLHLLLVIIQLLLLLCPPVRRVVPATRVVHSFGFGRRVGVQRLSAASKIGHAFAGRLVMMWTPVLGWRVVLVGVSVRRVHLMHCSWVLVMLNNASHVV